MTVTLRSCAVGGGHHAAYASRSYNGAYLCPKHLRMYMHGFNPRIKDSVRYIDGYGQCGWLVIARTGSLVTLRKIGLPDSYAITARVSDLCPGGFGHVYSNPKVRGCGK